VGGDILPQTALGGDLGSSTLPWRSLYVSQSTIYLGGVPLTLDASNNLTVNGSRVGGGVTSYNDLTGKPNLGVYATQNDITTVLNEIDSRITDISNIQSESDVSIQVNLTDSTARIWRFGEDGDLTLPSTGGFIDRLYTDNSGSRTKLEKKIESSPTTGTIAKLELDLDNGNIRLAIGNYTGGNDQWIDTSTWAFRGDTGSLTLPPAGKIINNNNEWTFGTDGALTIPGDIKSNSNINIDINLADSTLRRWQFGEDGALTLPSTGKISNSGYDWTFGSTGNTTFPTGLTLGAPRGVGTVNFTAAVDKEFQIETGTATSGKLWQFGTDGSLTLPGDIKSQGNINIDINLADSTLRRWQFGEDGILTLPSTGKISNSGYDWTFGTDGELALPNNGKIASGVDTAQVGSTTTIALNDQGTDQAYDVTYLGIDWTGNEAVFTTYAAGSTITFANGDVRTITEIQKNEVYGFPGQFSIDIYWSASRANLTAFPITLKTSNYAAAYTAPEWQFGSDGVITLPNGAVIKDTAGNSVVFGEDAGTTSQGANAVAIGTQAGNSDQGIETVAIGALAGQYTQGQGAVAVGFGAGYNLQGVNSVAIGKQAAVGETGANAVAIGYRAGYTNQAANTIILNASGVEVNGVAAQTNSFYVAPIRSATATANVVYYNTTTKEVTYGAAGSVSSLVNGANTASLGADGSLTLPGDIKSNGNINIDINLTDSTLRRWQFGEDGNLSVPGDINLSGGTISQYSQNGLTGLKLVANADQGQNVTIMGTGNNTFPILNYVGTTLSGITIGTPEGDWNFMNGNLTIPGDIKSNGNINIDINLADSTLRRWQFGEDGILTLPVGGDILNSTGTSVLGGSVSSLVNGAYTASLGNTGALTLPAGGIISEGGGLSGAIKLRPAGGANANQALLIYPTAGGDGDHIHLTAGGGTTELYLGDDSRYVKLVNGGDIEVKATTANQSATAAWIFGTDGAISTTDPLIIKVPNGVPNSVYNWLGQGGWNQGFYSAIATTGGTGTGLTVNVAAGGGGYININAITIANAGSGYTAGDVIMITNEFNLPGTFQIGVSGTQNWTFGIDGSLASNEFKIKTPNGIPTIIVATSNDTQFWDANYGSNLATTGGTGTGLTVNVSDGGSGYAGITINTPGTGYTPGDVITVTNGPLRGAPITSSVKFTIGISGTHSWTFNKYGNIAPPSGRGLQSVDGARESKVTLDPDQILSQVTEATRTRTLSNNEDFISANSDGTNFIDFVGLDAPTKKFLYATLTNYSVSNITVRLNGAGPEYGYSAFNGTDQIGLAGAGGDPIAPEGAVTEIRFSWTQTSKIDIFPDDGVFEIRSAPGVDMGIHSGDIGVMQATNGLRLRTLYDSVTIATNYDVPGATTYNWTFGTGGELTLPNGAVLRNTSESAVAFGQGAGLNSQSAMAIAIGSDAGYYTQGDAAVAIGESAGESYQGANAIAIGKKAGYNNQAANSIIINATGDLLEQTTANTFTVAPIRNISAIDGILQYNASTKEVSYSNRVTAETFNTDQITIVGNRIATTVTNANLELECNGTGGVVINTVADATTASTVKSVGYLGLPQSATATTATLAIGDAGKHIYITTTGQTITIPAAASVAYPIGTTLTFIAGPSATTTTIAITSDTLRLAGGTSTGTRTLAANGMATAVKVASTTWYINGTGLT
jgi:hypothetical protein